MFVGKEVWKILFEVERIMNQNQNINQQNSLMSSSYSSDSIPEFPSLGVKLSHLQIFIENCEGRETKLIIIR